MSEQWWSWVLTLVGVTCFFLAGRKVWWAWYVGLAGQISNRLIGGRLGLSSTREMDKDMLALSNGLDAISALLDATEPPANVTDLPKSDIPSEQMSLKGNKPAEDEREALIERIAGTIAAPWLVSHGTTWGDLVQRSRDPYMRDAREVLRVVEAAGYSKGPRPVTSEMVEAATFDWLCTRGIYTSLDQVPKQIVARERDRMRAALEAAEGARR